MHFYLVGRDGLNIHGERIRIKRTMLMLGVVGPSGINGKAIYNGGNGMNGNANGSRKSGEGTEALAIDPLSQVCTSVYGFPSTNVLLR
jgi:hypothetical protein